MKELKLIILYKDHHYKMISRKKFRDIDFSNQKIRSILVPCENGKCYFPLKPHYFLNFYKVSVNILHRIFAFDYEEFFGEDIKSDQFNIDCFDIIELGNALFNLYKFRGASILISENLDIGSGQNVTYTSYPTNIQVIFYNKEGESIGEIDSGDMISLEELYRPNELYNKPQPQYQCEDRFQCLDEILYIPVDSIYHESESQIDGIPSIINLFDEKHWRKVRYYEKEVAPNDFLLKKIQDFCAYIPIQADIYNLIDKESFKHAVVEFVCCPIAINYEKNYLPSTQEGKIPKINEKLECFQAFTAGEIFRPIPCRVEIVNVNLYLIVYSFFETIMNYIKYFTQASYGVKDTRYPNFVLFGDWSGYFGASMMLTETEFTEKKISDRFTKILGGTK